MRKLEVLTYTNELGESIVFSHSADYCPQYITGLSDIYNTIYSINSMGQDGDTFVSGRIESRNIDITGVIRERDPDRFRTLRRFLARVLNPQLSARLKYEWGDFVRVIDCRAENSPHVTKGVHNLYAAFTVQLKCLNPFWMEENAVRDNVAAWVNALELPLHIPVSGLVLGYRQPSLIVNVHNAGDVNTGIQVRFTVKGGAKNPSIINVDTLETFKVNLVLQDGDELWVSTAYGQKSVKLRRGGEEIDALRYADEASAFSMRLTPGDNLIRYDAEEGLQNLEVAIFHNNLYLGV